MSARDALNAYVAHESDADQAEYEKRLDAYANEIRAEVPTRIRHHEPPPPYGCRWCGEADSSHGRSYVRSKGLHSWELPTVAQVEARLPAWRAQAEYPMPF